MSCIIPEKYRIKVLAGRSQYNSKEGEGFGVFFIPNGKTILFCFFTDGDDSIPWEHVSVSVKWANTHKETNRCPSWEEMCKVKDLFWEKTDAVVQFHPPESEYVSEHHYCLHLWRKKGEYFETPPSIAVGHNLGQKI